MINCVNVNSDNLSYGRTEWFVNDRYNSGAIMPGYFTPTSSERCVYPKRKTWKDVPDYIRNLFDLLDMGWSHGDLKEVVSSLCTRWDEEGLCELSRPIRNCDFTSREFSCLSVDKVLIHWKRMAALVSMAMIDMDRPVRDFCVKVVTSCYWNRNDDCINDTAHLHIIEKKRTKSRFCNL